MGVGSRWGRKAGAVVCAVGWLVSESGCAPSVLGQSRAGGLGARRDVDGRGGELSCQIYWILGVSQIEAGGEAVKSRAAYLLKVELLEGLQASALVHVGVSKREVGAYTGYMKAGVGSTKAL